MSVLGWVFSILQAALGVTFLLRGLVAVFGLPWVLDPAVTPDMPHLEATPLAFESRSSL